MKHLSLLLAGAAIVALSSCNKTPTATFTTDVTSITEGDVVTFTNTSEDSYNAIWDFGDGTQSTANSPTHVYAVPGTYNVTLQVEDKKGKEVVVSAATTITVAAIPVEEPVAPSVSLSASSAAVMAGEMVTFTGTVENAFNVVWSFGDGGYNSSGLLSVMHQYYSAGTYTVTIQGTNEDGSETVMATTTVTVSEEADPTGDDYAAQQQKAQELREDLFGIWNYEEEEADHDDETCASDWNVDYDRDYRFYSSGSQIFITENDPESTNGNANWTSNWYHVVDNFISNDGYIWEVNIDGDDMTWTRVQYLYCYQWNGGGYDYFYPTRTVTRTFTRM